MTHYTTIDRYSPQSLTLPGAAKSIKAGVYNEETSEWDPAFQYFTNLRSLSGGNIETVGGSAFYRCTALEAVSLPAAQSIQ